MGTTHLPESVVAAARCILSKGTGSPGTNPVVDLVQCTATPLDLGLDAIIPDTLPKPYGIYSTPVLRLIVTSPPSTEVSTTSILLSFWKCIMEVPSCSVISTAWVHPFSTQVFL